MEGRGVASRTRHARASRPVLGLTGDGALRAAVEADRDVARMESVRMDHLAEYLADCASSWEPPLVAVPGVEELIRLGGPGSTPVPEFAVCEVAVALSISQAAATSLCADVLDLSSRLRRVSQSVRSGDLSFAKARLIARRTRDLSLAQVEVVETSVMTSRSTARGPVPVAALVPPGRLRTMVDQAVLSARGDKDAADEQLRVAESLFVQMVRTEHGATDVAARLASGDAVRLDRRLDQVAARLARIGDGRSVDVRRAVALALLADPAMLRALEKAPVVVDVPVPDLPDADIPLDLDMLPDACGPGSLEECQRAPGETPGDRGGPTGPHAVGSGVASSPPDPRQPVDDGRSRGAPAAASSVRRETPFPPPCLAASDTRGADPHPPDPAPGGPAVRGPDPVPPDPALGADDPDRSIPSRDQPAASTAMGVAGLPPGALEVLAGLTSTVLYVHLDAASDSWCEERAGALTAAQARALVGHANVTVRPILDLAQNLSYTGYQAPTLLREQLAMLNAGLCTFPSCGRRARVGDVDHEQRYGRGFVDPTDPDDRGGVTETTNTHLLCRKHHRAKTHGGWSVYSPAVGVWVWTSPAGARRLVTNGTTTDLDTDPALGADSLTVDDVTYAVIDVA